MADDGLLARDRDGVHLYYAIDDPTVSTLFLLVSTQFLEDAGK